MWVKLSARIFITVYEFFFFGLTSKISYRERTTSLTRQMAFERLAAFFLFAPLCWSFMADSDDWRLDCM